PGLEQRFCQFEVRQATDRKRSFGRRLQWIRPPPRSQSIHTHCVPDMPIARAAPRVKSSVTPCVNGPRSLITTVTDVPFLGLVTVTRDPNGSVRCAAVYPLGSNA